MKSIVKKSDQNYQTDNLQLASYLLAKGINLFKVERSGHLGIFFFSAKEVMPEVERFSSGRALIEPRSYSRAFRELRFRVDQVQDE